MRADLDRFRWSLAWQDTWFSLSFDRPSTTAIRHPEIPYEATSNPGGRTYFETQCRIISLTLEIVRERMIRGSNEVDLVTIQAYMERIRQILADAQLYLRFSEFCRTLTQRLQKAFLKLHASYISAELSRSTLRISPGSNHPSLASLRKDCIGSLVNTLEAYIEIHSIDPRASRAWIAFQRSISCAFLLAVIESSRSNPSIRMLLQKLELILAEHETADVSFKSSHLPDVELVTPVSKPLTILRKFNEAFRSQKTFASATAEGPSEERNRDILIPNISISPQSGSSLGSSPGSSEGLTAAMAKQIQPSLWSWNVGFLDESAPMQE
jgi:hypothetical protein